ncbi:MAG TPA: hypothetical protein VIT44_00755 [Cyclobacteriaceae bacterium]
MNSSKEIDLVELIAKGFTFLAKNLKLIVSTLLLSGVLGLVFYYTSPKTYESSMIIQSDILTESYADQIATILQRLIKEQNDSTLAAKLHLSNSEASQLRKIEIEPPSPTMGIIPEKEKIIFIITVQLTDYNLLPKLQAGLLKYLEENEYVKLRVRLKREMYTHLIEKMDKEIKSLDSIKTGVAQSLSSPKPMNESSLFFLNGSDFYTQAVEIYKEKFDAENELGIVASIQLIEPFSLFKKPASPKLSVSLAASVTLGLFILAGILGIKVLKKASDKLQNYKN